MADDVAELAPLGAQHAQAPARLGRHVDEVGNGQLRGSAHAVFQVLVALADDLQVQREHQRRAFGGLGAFDQAFDEIAVADHVNLKPERVVAGAGGHVFDRADAHGGERERHAKGLGRARRQNLTVGVLHAGQPDRGQRHRHRHRLTHHGAGELAIVHVDAHPLAQLDLLEIGFVGAVGALGPRAGIGIVVEHARHAFLRQHAQVFDVGDHGHRFSPGNFC